MDLSSIFPLLLLVGIVPIWAQVPGRPIFDRANYRLQLVKARFDRQSTHKFLGEPCNFPAWNRVMPGFWDDFFAERANRIEIINFKHRYPEIYVDFLTENNLEIFIKKWRSNHDEADDELIEDSVKRMPQRMSERERCMSGGLMVCKAVDTGSSPHRCMCMDNPDWRETELVDIATGDPAPVPLWDDPEWRKLGCFIKTNKPCSHFSYGEHPTPFMCTHYNICNYEYNKCQPPI